MSRVLITGVSCGIGEALAQLCLKRGHTVFGISRRTAYSMEKEPKFHGIQFDLSRLSDFDQLDSAGLSEALNGGIDTIILNAGISGKVPARGEAFSVDELQHVLSVNVLANKLLLDRVLMAPVRPGTCMVSASMAGVRFREGTLPYSMSKAALAAMAGVYARENPDVFFAVLGLCNVNTGLSRQVSFSHRTSSFPELKELQKRALTDNYMVSPEQRAQDICDVLAAPGDHGVISGEFVDIRTILPKAPGLKDAPQTANGTK